MENARLLIDDLLYISRMDLGHAQPALKPVDVNNWITQLADDRAVVFSERQCVTFSVRDTGPGISFEDMPHIFERFSTEAGPRPGGA